MKKSHKYLFLCLFSISSATGYILTSGCCNPSNDVAHRSTDNDSIAEDINKYLSWTQSPETKGFIADRDNPYRQSLVNRGHDVVDYIIANQAQLITPANQLSIIWLLGEITDPQAFQLLLALYRQSPNMRSAISLAACTSIDRIDTLINALNDKELVILLDSILNDEDRKGLQGLIRDDIINYWKTNYDSIRQTVLQKTKPNLG